jgi:hypothetical protein
MAPPHRACQPSARFDAFQSSQSVSVDGCHTVRCWSSPGACLASGGIGTASNAPWRFEGVSWSSLTRTACWSPSTT